jgi:hypothetical protein
MNQARPTTNIVNTDAQLPFQRWVLKNGMTVAVTTAITVAAFICRLVIDLVHSSSKSPFDANFGKWAIVAVDFAHVFLLSVALIWTYNTRHEFSEVTADFPKNVRKDINIFSLAWMTLILVWLVLYSGYSIQDLAAQFTNPTNVGGNVDNRITGFVMTIPSLGEIACFYWLYSILSASKRSENPWDRSVRDSDVFPAICLFGICTVSLFSLQQVFVYSFFFIPGLIQQLLLTISIAMFVGRLDSVFNGVPNYLLSFLYIYAALQLVYPTVLSFSSFPPATQYLVPCLFGLGLAVLVLKMLLILVISWLFTRGVFHRYIMINQAAARLNCVPNKNFPRALSAMMAASLLEHANDLGVKEHLEENRNNHAPASNENSSKMVTDPP